MNIPTIDDIRLIIGEVIGNVEVVKSLDEDSPLLGAVPEFDSVAVFNLLLTFEEKYDVIVEDDEVDIEIFESVGAFHKFAKNKIHN